MGEPATQVNLLSYYQNYQTVRGAVSGFDTLISDVLFKGSGAIVAIVAASLALFNVFGNQVNWATAFGISLFALFAGLYLLSVIALYSDLLRRSVLVAEGLEAKLFGKELSEDLWLTTRLEDHPLAGGRLGSTLYMLLVMGVHTAAGGFSAFYYRMWTGDIGLVWPMWLAFMAIWVPLIGLLGKAVKKYSPSWPDA